MSSTRTMINLSFILHQRSPCFLHSSRGDDGVSWLSPPPPSSVLITHRRGRDHNQSTGLAAVLLSFFSPSFRRPSFFVLFSSLNPSFPSFFDSSYEWSLKSFASRKLALIACWFNKATCMPPSCFTNCEHFSLILFDYQWLHHPSSWASRLRRKKYIIFQIIAPYSGGRIHVTRVFNLHHSSNTKLYVFLGKHQSFLLAISKTVFREQRRKVITFFWGSRQRGRLRRW